MVDGMMDDVAKPSDAEQARLLAAVKGARKRIAKAKDSQRAAVIEALDGGVSAQLIGDALGVTRHRVYQIRDGN